MGVRITNRATFTLDVERGEGRGGHTCVCVSDGYFFFLNFFFPYCRLVEGRGDRRVTIKREKENETNKRRKNVTTFENIRRRVNPNTVYSSLGQKPAGAKLPGGTLTTVVGFFFFLHF